MGQNERRKAIKSRKEREPEPEGTQNIVLQALTAMIDRRWRLNKQRPKAGTDKKAGNKTKADERQDTGLMAVVDGTTCSIETAEQAIEVGIPNMGGKANGGVTPKNKNWQ